MLNFLEAVEISKDLDKILIEVERLAYVAKDLSSEVDGYIYGINSKTRVEIDNEFSNIANALNELNRETVNHIDYMINKRSNYLGYNFDYEIRKGSELINTLNIAMTEFCKLSNTWNEVTLHRKEEK